MLTKNDLKQIENLNKLLIIGSNSQILKEIDGLKAKLEDMDGKISFLPTKEEYFSSMAELMGEVKNLRQTQETSGHQLADHSDKLQNHEERIGKLEKKASFPAI